MWTVKTKRDGSEALVPNYQKNILRKLLSEKEPIGSGLMHKHLIETMGEHHPSRASIIFFMNDLVECGYADFKDGTGKGGHHRLYYTELTSEQFITNVTMTINHKLVQAFSEIFN